MSNKVTAGEAFVRVTLNDSSLVAGLRGAQAKLSAFGAAVTSYGKGFATWNAGVMGLGMAAAVTLASQAHAFSETGGAMMDMSQRTGVAVEALSELSFAAEQSGADAETLEAGIRKMQKTMAEAEAGSKAARTELAQVGLTVQDLKGLAPDQQFAVIADAIGKIPDPAQRTAAAMGILGKSGTKLLPMFTGGAAGIAEMREQARELGLTMSGEDAAAAEAFGDTLDVLLKVISRVGFTIGAALEPTLTDMIQAATAVTARIVKWINENRELVAWAFKLVVAITIGAGILAGFGVAIMGVGTALSIAGTAIGGFVAAGGTILSILGAIFSPLGLLIVAVVSLGTWLLWSSGVADKALGWIASKFNELKTEALASWGAIAAALARGDIAAAGRVVWALLKLEWQKGINFLEGIWLSLQSVISTAWTRTVYGLAAVFVDMGYSIASAWESTLATMRTGWTSWSGLVQKGVNSLTGFFQGLGARIRGLFDENFNVEAELKSIAEYTAAVNAGVDAETAAKNQQRQRDAEAKKAQLNAERDAMLANLDQMSAAELAAKQKAHDAALAANEAELAAARNAWAGLVADAAGSETQSSGGLDPATQLSEDLANQIGDGIKRAGSAKGTFNAAGAASLAATSVTDRATKAAEKTEQHLQKLVDAAKRNRLVFAK